MATNAIDSSHADHGHHHEHPKFLAHHFDTPEQQFDSGKLGIWLFLVTEVLFFSGMFCAYAIFRSFRPDVFVYSSEFLNTTLGAINTCVLLFSSLTMAWAVRAAQLGQHKLLVKMLAATLSCATIFLGVKAVEYSHKWGIGLNPGGLYSYQTDHANTDFPFLAWLCVIPALILVGVVIWHIMARLSLNEYQVRVSLPLIIVAAAFFGGVILGRFLESGHEEHGAHDEHAVAMHIDEGQAAGDAIAPDPTTKPGVPPDKASTMDSAAAPAVTSPAPPAESPVAALEADDLVMIPEEAIVLEKLAQQKDNSGVRSALESREAQAQFAGSSVVTSKSGHDSHDEASPMAKTATDVINEKSQNRLAATFFGIYYCMTGVHALHIIGGIVVLVWLLFRAVREDFSRQYFGPVDYVGLYWHLVDLIWIYLFPLLYLIR